MRIQLRSCTGYLTVLVLCAAVSACGGNARDGGNAAASRTFAYGPPQAVSWTPSSAIGNALPLFEAGISAEAGYWAQTALHDAANVALAFETLSPTGSSIMVPESTVAPAPGCASVTATGVTFTSCTSTLTVVSASTDGTSWSARVTTTLDGQLELSDDTLRWTYAVVMTSDRGESGAYTDSGFLSATAATLSGHEELEWSSDQPAPGVGPGALAQALDLQVTYDRTCTIPCFTTNGVPTTCPSPVVGGTLEAKRVWTQVPSGAPSVRDHAAKLVWTGCNEATAQYSTP